MIPAILHPHRVGEASSSRMLSIALADCTGHSTASTFNSLDGKFKKRSKLDRLGHLAIEYRVVSY